MFHSHPVSENCIYTFCKVCCACFQILHLFWQADCELVKIDIHCHIQGDIVMECISLDSDYEREQMMFRVMFNTAFIRSNILMFNRDEIDTLWNAKDQFPKDFRAEVSSYLSFLEIYYD